MGRRRHPPRGACPRLAVVEHLRQCLRGRACILHRIGGLPVPELLLHRRNIAGLGNDMLPHSMPRTTGRPPLHLRDATDLHSRAPTRGALLDVGRSGGPGQGPCSVAHSLIGDGDRFHFDHAIRMG